MSTKSTELIFETLDSCWICGGQAWKQSHEERFDLGASGQDEDHREVLGSNRQLPHSASRV